MAKYKFRDAKISKSSLQMLSNINSIIEEYQENGYVLTLRQLYYQLVSRDIIANKVSEYSKLSILLKEGRMAGIVDWEAIEDRLRKPSKPSSWDSPLEILETCISAYARNRQENQPNYIEVWVEKDALSGVLERVTRKYHIPIMVNRGYSSATAMYDSFKRFENAYRNDQQIHILYLGDFDPSGKDMLRDIEKRTAEFIYGRFYDQGNELTLFPIHRILEDFQFNLSPIALTAEQIRQYNPPPNPAKKTDPRAKQFIKQYGASSWEVDALRPETLTDLLVKEITSRMDLGIYNQVLEKEKEERQKLIKLSKSL